MYPAAISNIDPFSSHDSCERYPTNGTINLGSKLANASFGSTVSVILDAAIGAMVFVLMFLFSPSLANVNVRP